jgi:hypothetical protein
MTGAGRSGRSAPGAVAGAVVDVVLPLAVYYGLRAAGVGIYLALLGGALACAAGAAVTLARTRRVTGMTGYVLTMMLLSTGVALLVGSPRFLLAREGWITGVTGLWFIASLATHRPLAYLFPGRCWRAAFGGRRPGTSCGTARRGSAACGGSPACSGASAPSPTPRCG